MSEHMTEMFRCRVDRKIIRNATRVAEQIGTTPGEVVRLLFAQMLKRRAIPFPLQADSPEAEVLGPVERRAKMWDDMNEGNPPMKFLALILACLLHAAIASASDRQSVPPTRHVDQ